MGAIVQKQDSLVQGSLNQPKEERLLLSHFQNPLVLPNGLTVIRMESGEPGLFYTKEINTQPEKELMLKWAQMNSQFSCNVVKYQVETLSMFCSSHMQFKAIIEYGHQSLAETLLEKQTCWKTVLDRSQTTITEKTVKPSLEILTFIKFLIEVVEEHLKCSSQWVTFHTTNIVYQRHQKRFKYIYLPSAGLQDRETFYDPYTSQQGFLPSQATTVFSIGMLLMSLLLKDDCSDCYNYQNRSFCWSIFQEKKDKVQDELLQKSAQDLSSSDQSYTIEKEIISLTLAALCPDNRPSFSNIKTLYYGILRKMASSSGQGRDQLRRIKGKNKSKPTGPIYRKYTMENQSEIQNKENRNHSNLNLRNSSLLFLDQSSDSANNVSEVWKTLRTHRHNMAFDGIFGQPVSPIMKKKGGKKLNI